MRKFLILLGLFLIAAPLSAQWRRAGLFGADVRALIADPSAPDTFYLGTSGGEVYVSRDGAKTWSAPRNGSPFPNYVVDNLMIDREGRLWAACWGLWGGGVIAVSNDGGKTWTRRDDGLEDFSVRAIAVDANDANFVVAGGLTGVYRSKDGGESWDKISDQINVESLAIDPRDRNRIYVGTWRQGMRTEDGGKTWAPIANGMVLDTDMFSITIDEKNPDNMWVATCGWVYNSGNRGDLWTRYRDGFNNRRIHDIEIDPCDEDLVYAGSVAGLYRSEDKGKTWYTLSDEGLVINSIVLHPQRPERIVLGVEGDGVYISQDRGKTFQRASDGLHNLRITTIVPDPNAQQRVYATVVFGGAASGMYRSDDAGLTWTKVSTTKLPEVLTLTIAPEPDAEVKFIAGTEKGFFWSSDAVEWNQAEPAGFPIRVEKVVRFNRSRSFAATAEGVFTTRDGGKNWYRLAGADQRAVDLTIGMLGTKKALYALTSNGLTVFDGDRWLPIANAPAKGRTIALRNDGSSQLIYVAGASGVKAGRINAEGAWEAVEAPNAQYAAVYGSSRGNGEMLFLASREQREILVGDAGGSDWTELTLPSRNTEVTSVAPDPFVRDRYYIATLGEGVFIYKGKTQRYIAKTDAAALAAAGGGSK
ncbi:MAG TPA: YCF48-related protein [Thermoanaerobaculia bacterium]|nr:YCF48-related protein [Thermoanaerobaculia bacterium]